MIIDTEQLTKELLGKDIRKVKPELKVQAQAVEELYVGIIRPDMIEANTTHEDWRIK